MAGGLSGSPPADKPIGQPTEAQRVWRAELGDRSKDLRRPSEVKQLNAWEDHEDDVVWRCGR